MKSQKGFAPIIIIIAVVLVGGATYALVPRTVLKSFFEKGDMPVESQKTRGELKEEFKNGDIPDQDDFADTIDSALNLPDDGDLLGLKEYEPTKEYIPGDTQVYNDTQVKSSQFTGIVVTGASQGTIKQHCADGLYLAVDAGLEMNARQKLWLLKDTKGQMLTGEQYVGHRVSITGTYPESNKLRCEALICGCEEYLTVETIVQAS